MSDAASKLRADALTVFRAALQAVEAGNAIRRNLSAIDEDIQAGNVRVSARRFDRIFLVAAGKAAPQMAAAVEALLGKKLSGGIVVTKYGHALLSSNGVPSVLRNIEAGHPIPDENGVRASHEIETLVQDLGRRDLLIAAISGGASALLCAPVDSITLAAKQQTTDLLLRAGSDIFELNCVRKHLSSLKGGNLAAQAHPATVISLLLSDVIGDPIDVIGSGLTAADATTFAMAISVLEKRGVLNAVPAAVRNRLERGAAGCIRETPKPGDRLFDDVHNIIVASNRLALESAAQVATKLGYRALILSSEIQGEAREAARVHADILLEARASGNPVKPPACILSGGETTVTVRGSGKGGRNQEFALAASLAIAESPNTLIFSAGTDGTDGPTDAAGAIATGDTVARARQLGLQAFDYLNRNDSYTFFEVLGDLVKTGPTGTNVMDINILLADA